MKYLGFELSKGQRNLLLDGRETFARIAVPTAKRQLGGFLGMAAFCCIWILNFGLMAKPLSEAFKGNNNEPLSYTVECHWHPIPYKRLMKSMLADLT